MKVIHGQALYTVSVGIVLHDSTGVSFPEQEQRTEA